MWIAVREAGGLEGVAKYFPNRCCIAPAFAVDADSGKMTILIEYYLRRRK